ncbi:vWA domain-containing protein [Eubacterium maltosivorans]|uniref:VWA domain-containing protein n=1 Tax=Eubacterium maltosivorans TaxID=2041044 RepID=A0A4P9CE00_EUBML|nr:VWA domain-containing protein [Eubacterium maltosivorans]QCT73195.1 VWA domain-containing protein [Eubacterium maltosivorans]
MNPNLTEIIFILDRSGSMAGLEADTIGGYNQFLKTQSQKSGELRVTTVLFDHEYECLYQSICPENAVLTERQYFVRGCTALYDAVGQAVIHTGRRLAETPEPERPSKVIVVITTDGCENASKAYTHQQIQNMIRQQQEKYSWEFLFFGANIDVENVAQTIGVQADRAFSYEADSAGVCKMMACACDMVSTLREALSCKNDAESNS